MHRGVDGLVGQAQPSRIQEKLMNRPLLGLAVAMIATSVVLIPTGPASASAGTDYCLNGWVWRQARPSDHVCVRDTVRAQARADNAAARRRWTFGAHGPKTCVSGYVWRGAFTKDRVCVRPAVHAQTVADNAKAADLWVTTNIFVGTYYAPRDPSKPVSPDNYVMDVQVKGDHFNFGQTKVDIRKSNNELVWSGTVEATSNQGLAGGSFTLNTPVVSCTRLSDDSDANAYVQVQDGLSGRWSDKVLVKTGC
jgi:hypothetical protein